MHARYISDADLAAMTPAEVAALWMNHDTYLSLCTDRDALIDVLFEAPSNSPLANDTIDTLSVLVSAIDAYEERLIKEAA